MNVELVMFFCVHSAVFKNITNPMVFYVQSMKLNNRTVRDTILFLIVMTCTKKWEH